MKKKIVLGLLAFFIIAGAFTAWKLLGASVTPPQQKYLYIPTHATYQQVTDSLQHNKIINTNWWFDKVAGLLKYTDIKPGRYEIKKGTSLMQLVRLLKNGQQSPVNFVITKIRTKEVLASRIGKAFECDSTAMLHYLNNADSLRAFGLDTTTVMAAALPLTYTLKWNSNPATIFKQFYIAYQNFWTAERKAKADSLRLSPVEVVTVASIIDEETNAKTDRPNIASTYLNRIRIGMPLQADPTVKFALRNFGLRRILHEHLKVVSPYNTYINKGLPPGPICTPMLETVEAVLNAPKTDYLYFVASSAFDGTHIFTTNYADHLKYARIYQSELNKRNIK